jgi:hypothetical protein
VISPNLLLRVSRLDAERAIFPGIVVKRAAASKLRQVTQYRMGEITQLVLSRIAR